MPKQKTTSACRDCTLCTGHVFTGLGRNVERGSIDIASLGVTALIRKKCKLCEHPMSEHLGRDAQVVRTVGEPAPVPQAPAAPQVPAGWYVDGQGTMRWWDGLQWTAHVQPLPPQATQQE
jgi:hypothetical protein